MADFLVACGDDRDDLNVFASRCGNWEVMVRAAFHSKTRVNQLRPGMPVAHTLHVPSGDVMPIWDVARRYGETGVPVVRVAGERYGTGSSRDWAARGQRLLGVRAVGALSFERIHRSKLSGLGTLPLRRFTPGLPIVAGGRIEIDIDMPPECLQARARLDIAVWRADGRRPGRECRCMTEAATVPARHNVSTMPRATTTATATPARARGRPGASHTPAGPSPARNEQFAVGTHLPAQMLADRLRVSRSPINEVLKLLHEKGLVSRARDRGFFLAQPLDRRLNNSRAPSA